MDEAARFQNQFSVGFRVWAAKSFRSMVGRNPVCLGGSGYPYVNATKYPERVPFVPRKQGLRQLHGDGPKLLSIRGPIFRFLL